MNQHSQKETEFLEHLSEVLQRNLEDEHFGVSDLARELGMSRSNLHRKVKEITKLSASQYLRQERLKKAHDLLRKTSLTVSQVSFKVGFSGVSYFVKCFHDYYGYPPGEVGKRRKEEDVGMRFYHFRKKRFKAILVASFILVLSIFLYLVIYGPYNDYQKNRRTSIAILRPECEDKDSTCDELIKGTMRMVNDNLCLIEDIKVTPWLSVHQYSNNSLSAVEIAERLKVKYLVSSSYFTFDSKIHLFVNLTQVEREVEDQVWDKKFVLDAEDLGTNYHEISEWIAELIKVRITPDEKKRMKKILSSNSKAMNYYYSANEIFSQSNPENLESAIPHYEDALKHDPNFALAWAELALVYYYLNEQNSTPKYQKLLDKYSGWAMNLDDQLDMSLISLALHYRTEGFYDLASKYLVKATQYNPNSAISYRLLAQINNMWNCANPERCLEFALKALEFHITEQDNRLKAKDYWFAARALRSNGFYAEAMEHIETAIALDPGNPQYIDEQMEILIDRDRDYTTARHVLLQTVNIDSSLPIIIRHIATNYYYNGEFLESYKYYQKLSEDEVLTEWQRRHLARKAVLFNKLGMEEEANRFIKLYEEAVRIGSNYYAHCFQMIMLNCLKNDVSNALKYLEEFSSYKLFRQHIRLLWDDPIFESIRETAEFSEFMDIIENKFQKDQMITRKNLEQKGLM